MKHPAKMTDVILEEIARHVLPGRLLNPFAGTGRIHLLEQADVETWGVELEPEWANMHPRTILGDATALPFVDDSFDCIATSPCYGNRMADHHEAKDNSRRITYRHTLGRPLHPNNAGQLQWGKQYRKFHYEAWTEVVRTLKPGGRFILNCSDHIRKGEVQPVTTWHKLVLVGLGLHTTSQHRIETPRMGFGANAAARVGYESVIVMDRW